MSNSPIPNFDQGTDMHPSSLDALAPFQLVRRFALALALMITVAAFVVVAAWPNDRPIHLWVEFLSAVAMIVCIVGRCWCTLYIGGKKGELLVDLGPYSICRNPLYLFSIIGAFGFGAQTGSLVIGAMCATLIWLILRWIIAREERFLLLALGAPYAEYRRRVPRLLPSFALWRSVETIEVSPKRVAATLLDGAVLALSVPISMGLEHAQALGWLPVFFVLP